MKCVTNEHVKLTLIESACAEHRIVQNPTNIWNMGCEDNEDTVISITLDSHSREKNQ